MTDTAPDNTAANPIRTKADMLKALEPLAMDDEIMIGVYPPKGEDSEADAGFSEGDDTAPIKSASDVDGDDDDDYIECEAYDHEIVTHTDGSGKRALMLYADPQAEIEELVEKAEADGNADPDGDEHA